MILTASTTFQQCIKHKIQGWFLYPHRMCATYNDSSDTYYS